MTKYYRLMLGDRMLPIDMRAVAADEHGDIIRIDSEKPITFEFTHRGLDFAGQVTTAGDAHALRLTAEIAAPATDRLRRERAAIAAAANRRLGPVFAVDGDNAVFTAEAPLVDALTTVNLVAGIAALLVPAAPFLDLFRDRMAAEF